MDQTIRNKLRGVVTQCRKLLEDTTAQSLQGRFGIYAARKKGEVQIEDETRMSHLTDEDRACRQDLLDHLEHIQAIGYKPSEALEQLVREIAFTHLNRLCAYKLMESRGLIREAVSRGLKSQGFFFYLADHPEDEKLHNGGGQETAYRNFLDWLGGTLSQEIGVLFNPNDPANRIYPPQRVLDGVLTLINDGELKDIWSQDETIGWVYQYFTPKELRDKARKESQAPRNSYELAFRNQFFTPRYVVEFLTDNTLGRIWCEMRNGKTILKDRCKYLVRRPTEIFLKDGEQPPAESKVAREDLSQEELLKQAVFIPHRLKKDPRELKVLDPACGSGHFLLYCFDLLQTIYEEAYDDPDLGAALRKDYSAIEDLRRAVPGLILKNNLHGIDIDLRATQIAALALWLRCQRAYQELGLKNGERPKITRSNIVCAEPMPGETDLLKEFTTSLQPKVLGQLVEAVFAKMKLVGEAGSLLKIDEEIREAASKAKFEFIQWKKHKDKAKWSLFPELVKRDQPSIFDFADMTDEIFLDRAEEEIVAALRQYAERASNGRVFRRRLFAEDAVRGFSFVDVCSKRYDVLLMNPPFGIPPASVFKLLKKTSPIAYVDLYSAFIIRAGEMCQHGLIGAISSRSFLMTPRLTRLREQFLLDRLVTILDLGAQVMDEAEVESCAYVISSAPCDDDTILACNMRYDSEKQLALSRPNVNWSFRFGVSSRKMLRSLPGGRMFYGLSARLISLLKSIRRFEPDIGTARCGGRTFDDFRFLRALWEVPAHCIGRGKVWVPFCKGGEFSLYYGKLHLLIKWENDGEEIAQKNIEINGQTAQARQASSFYFRPGATYSQRSKAFGVRAMPEGCIFSSKGPAVFSESNVPVEYLIGWLNTDLVRLLVEFQANKYQFDTGIIKRLPWHSPNDKSVIDKYAHRAAILIEEVRASFEWNESDPHFSFRPVGASIKEVLGQQETKWEDRAKKIASIINEWNHLVEQLYGVTASELQEAIFNQHSEGEDEEASECGDSDLGTETVPQHEIGIEDLGQLLLSVCVGCSFGRLNIKYIMGQCQQAKLSGPFAPIPACSPSMLQGPDGLPAKPEDVTSDYPIRIGWDGIMVGDPEHEDDIVRRVREVLEAIWKDRAEAIEQELCEILGVRQLRDYFHKPGNGGFWMDHVKRYSKSRRKAPIYWYLRSSKGNYGLWLYYHRLDKDILFKALLNYVEPKIRLEEDRLKSLRNRREAAGSSGREAKQIEKDIDRQDQLVSELHDFADKLRRAANFHLVPDLNDGVVLTIAPLFELVPWKEAKDYWEDLVAGKCEWSSIGRQMREKGLVKI